MMVPYVKQIESGFYVGGVGTDFEGQTVFVEKLNDSRRVRVHYPDKKILYTTDDMFRNWKLSSTEDKELECHVVLEDRASEEKKTLGVIFNFELAKDFYRSCLSEVKNKMKREQTFYLTIFVSGWGEVIKDNITFVKASVSPLSFQIAYNSP